MPSRLVDPIVMTFGGGLQTRRRQNDVDLRECVTPSVNFELDPQYHALNRRKPFDLVGTATNGSPIRGFAQLIKTDGMVSTLVQAGTTVYEWDGDATFTSVGTVSSSARLRGPREHNFTLNQTVIITDLEKNETVKTWDGTTFADLNHNLAGNFKAKYCRIHRERAFYANITTTTDTPHLLLGSGLGDPAQLSNANRPSNSLSTADAFFLITPDLRPINGLEGGFGQFLMSTEKGRMFILTGDTAQNFDVKEFHVGSAVSGDEALKNIGNDVLMGLPGRIETLTGTLNFGDVEANDLSLPISDVLKNVPAWTIEYDRRLQRAYCFPQDVAAVYVFYKSVINDPSADGGLRLHSSDLSPWSKWTTTHSLGFQPTTVMQMINPVNGREDVFMGDNSGNIYRIDGEGRQDGGTADITVKRRSGLIAVPEGNVFDVEGYIHYRKQFAETVTIRLLFAGVSVFDQDVDVSIPGATVALYGGDFYYGDDSTIYGVEFGDRIFRQDWQGAGNASHLQIEIEFSGAIEVDIQEIGFTFKAATT